MIAVKFYSKMPSDDENVLKGISVNIPAVVEFTDILPDETYTMMSDEEYNIYIESIKPELDEWKVILDSKESEVL